MMRLTDDEIQEWHEYVLKQRDHFKRILENIVNGVPRICGMASGYRHLTLKEIQDIARKALGWEQ